jgi:hypothetical protein
VSGELALADSTMSLGIGLKVLEREAKSGSPWSVAFPTLLNPSEMNTMESVFQPRSLDGRRAEDAGHIRNLMSVVQRDMGKGNAGKPTFLSPILVWWSGQNWYVIDGHHMRQAYEASGLEQVPVPVECFSGTIEDAIAESIRRNSKDQLVMRKDDKLRAAWRLVLTNESMSISQVVGAASVASRSVSNMRKAKRTLLEQGMTKDDLLNLSWGQAKALSEGRKLENQFDDADEKLQRMAEAMCKTLVKHIGERVITQPDVLAKALLMLEQRLPGWLMESPDWRDITLEIAEAMVGDEAQVDGDASETDD